MLGPGAEDLKDGCVISLNSKANTFAIIIIIYNDICSFCWYDQLGCFSSKCFLSADAVP